MPASVLKTVWSKRQPPGVFCKKQKKVFLGVLEISWEKCLCWGLFLMKLPALGSELLLKRDSGSGVFRWDLGNSC